MKLKVSELGASYDGEKILEDISLQVGQNEFVSILGPSGCGKSTILNMIAGLFAGDGAKIYVDGDRVTGLSEHFAYMPQQDLLLPWKTVMDNVCLYGQIHRRKKQTRQRAAELIGLFGLSGYEDSYPGALSGGMRQRAAFLRTALCAADIMLLDEPFGALDVISRNDMQDWLVGMRTRLDKTMILVTHDIDEAIYLSDRILILKGKPAGFCAEIAVPDSCRTRGWLFEQSDLKKEIYRTLKG